CTGRISDWTARDAAGLEPGHPLGRSVLSDGDTDIQDERKATAGRWDGPIASALRVALVGAVVILLIWVLSDVVLLIFLAILLAAMLDGIAGWLHRTTRLPEHVALAVVTVTIVVLVCGLAYWVGP